MDGILENEWRMTPNIALLATGCTELPSAEMRKNEAWLGVKEFSF